MPLIKASNVDQSSVPSVDCIDFGNFCLTRNQLCYILELHRYAIITDISITDNVSISKQIFVIDTI